MPSLAAALASLLGSIRRPGDFFAAGTAELLPPALEVEGVGPVALPLLPAQAGELVAVAQPAPFGRGTETIFDPAVRRCWQIGPERVRIGGRHWPRTLDGILGRVVEGLGVEAPVEAQFYKLLIYERGGHFVGHRDTEKTKGMFATLVVALPSRFEGGELVLRHGGREERLDLRAEDPAEAAFVAFYADCVHEVLPVTTGHRLILTYNLVRPGRARAPEPPSYAREQAKLAALLRRWRDRPPRAVEEWPEKLVYPLEHAYTPAELGFATLKGADAAAAGVLDAAAREAGFDLHLALVTVEESGWAEYTGDYGWGRRGRHEDDEDEFEIGEVTDRAVTLSEWRRPDGAPAAIGPLPVGDEEFSPPDAAEDLDPDEVHFREATGNEGASFERTYQRAALVLWPGERLFAVLSQAGLAVTLPFLDDLVRRWADGEGEAKAALGAEAHALAGHMIDRWPRREWGYGPDREASDVARMLALLTRLDDRPMIARMLGEVVAVGSHAKRDNDAILAALAQGPPERRAALAQRIVAGTAGTSFDACADLLARLAARWPEERAGLESAAAALVAGLPGGPKPPDASDSWRRPSTVAASVVADLVAGLAAIDPVLAERAADTILERPKTYGMDAVLVPALRLLLGAGRAQEGAARNGMELASLPPAAGRLRDAALAHLRARVAEPLVPPSDWRRDSRLPCRCPRCAALARFLDDPRQKTWLLKAAESERRHVEETVKRAGSDVDAATDRRGRPYTLVLTKNRASYERRAKQREQDSQDLALLGG